MWHELKFPALTILAAAAAATSAWAQVPPPQLIHVEPGLEKAVRWKWHVEPGPARDWGMELPDPPPTLNDLRQIPGAPANIPGRRPATYTVQRGDALIKISKRFDVPLDVLKKVNGLTSNLIRVGDELKIPTPEQVAALAPKPTPKAPTAARQQAQTAPDDTLLLQVFLDRAGFSAGPIDGRTSPGFFQILQLYVTSHDDISDATALAEKARTALKEPVTTYRLRREDFRFIAPPKAQPNEPTPTPSRKKKSAKPKVEPTPKPTYEDMTTTRMLAYRSPWEFVAERFHCSEEFLHQLNPEIELLPPIGTEFRVPAVVPFQIEKALENPIQPPPTQNNPMTASIVDLTRFELRRGDKLLAAMPVSIARPGLRGRDSWTILTAMSRPRLSSVKESRNPPPKRTRIYGRESPNAVEPTPTPTPEEQILPAGPNNPVGLVWIDLAKTPDGEPMSYGLHGTSIPDEMATHESLGGIRMANWDIARVVRFLPPGTPLQWTTSPPPQIAAPVQ